jgi:hypothetical protein
MKADVWVLTESRCALSLGPEFAFAACSQEAVDLKDDPDRRWVVIWVRKEVGITTHREETQHDVERTACTKLTRNGRSLYIYGTVLPWQSNAAFGKALEEQQADWKRLRESDPDAGFCVAGDLNKSLHSTRAYFPHCEELDQALRERQLASVNCGYHDPVHGVSKRRSSIDHICVSRNVESNEIEPGSGFVCLVPRPSRGCRHDDENNKISLRNSQERYLTDHFGVMAAVNF